MPVYKRITAALAPVLDGDADVAAVLFHELLHIGETAPDEETGEIAPQINPHDAEVFFAELEHYGTRAHVLRPTVDAIKQLQFDV